MMKLRGVRAVSLFLALCIFLCCVAPIVPLVKAGAPDFENTYVNTGNQRKDIIGVALTQLGYMEGQGNNTKYGTWYGMPRQPWCAMFVVWCATQADISTDVLDRTAVADPGPGYFNIPYYDGAKYTPQPGDLFFTKEFSHVGLVYKVEGDYFYTLEGNSSPFDDSVIPDPEREDLYVISNKRPIKKYYFGVPKYKGADESHSYVKGQDSGHPHKTFYECKDCGDKFYTGYDVCVAGCKQCLSCGCLEEYAGYYTVDVKSAFLNVRAGHGTEYKVMGTVSDDMVVYVHGANPYSGWAYIEYDGMRGHIAMSYLKAYYPAPKEPKVSLQKSSFMRGDTMEISWDVPENTEEFCLQVYRDGTRLVNEQMEMKQSYTLDSVVPGDYEIRVIARNRTGSSPAGVRKLNVSEVYTVSYNARGGSNAPTAQIQARGGLLQLSKEVPVREGYTFLGWTDNNKGNFVVYNPGDNLSSQKDVSLYAVWKSNEATLDSVAIERMPYKTMYLPNDTLDTTGLQLRLFYSDGSGHWVTDGFTTTGFNPEAPGTQTVTIVYGERTTTFDVQIVSYIPGDINLDRKVNRDDVMQLLWHISFPERYPIEVPADFVKDGVINRDDVMHLLWHISFPDRFPLELEEEQPTEPEVTEPEVTEPETTEPEATEPEVTEPEATEPEATEPETTEPETTEPEATEPEATEPEATEPEATEPEVTEPEAEDPVEQA